VVDELQLDERRTEMLQSFLAVGCDNDARVFDEESRVEFGQSFMKGGGYAQV
jgi:hypothetical protein